MRINSPDAAIDEAAGTASRDVQAPSKTPAMPRFTFTSPFSLADLAFSVKTFVAGIGALLISYWLEVKEPQWALVTVYLMAQPMVGAILSKSAYRLVGTALGAVFAMCCIGLFAQAGPLFILVMAICIAACTYGATLSRNFATYGFGLAAYSALLIGFGSVDAPELAWSMAGDRLSEVGLGIICTALVHVAIFPHYARDALNGSIRTTFSALARYAAVVLRPGTPDAVFHDLRRQMATDVVKFDALRSYAVFETPSLKSEDEALSRTLRAFLGLLSVARGLFVRLTELRAREDRAVAERLDPVLDRVARLLETVADEKDGPHSPAAVAAIEAARRAVAGAHAELSALAGTAPIDQVSESLLVLQRTGDMLASLARAVAASTGGVAVEPPGPRMAATVEPDQKKALIQAARAGAAVLAIGAYWIFSAWTAGSMAMIGLAVMMVFFATAENPAQMAMTFVMAVMLSMVVGFFGMVVVVPQVGDFVPLAAFLALVLIPSGLVMTKSAYAFPAAVFSAFFATQVGLTNLPSFDIGPYIDNAIGLLLGLSGGVLMIALVMPYDPRQPRLREWTEVVNAMPGAARGERPEINARMPILLALLKLLPRLDLMRTADDETMNGSFGLASMALELVRLRNRIDGPDFPAEARARVAACLDELATGFERLPSSKDTAARIEIVDAATASVASARTDLAALPRMPGDAGTIALAHAEASLHFIADRFDTDRAFLTRTIA